MKNRKSIVTGATGFLGKIIADTLAELGSDLILIDLPNTQLEVLKDNLSMKYSIKINCYECDLESTYEREKTLVSITNKHNKINCLINNAAFVARTELDGWLESFENQSIDTWRRAFEVNLTSVFHLSQYLTPFMRNSKGANIINISSIYGQYAPVWDLYEGTEMGNPAAYACSKSGVIQLTKWLSTTLAPNIRINCISPGGVYRNQPQQFINKYEKRTPLGRMAKEEDLKGAIAFLASDMSEYITGHILNVDGGWGVW